MIARKDHETKVYTPDSVMRNPLTVLKEICSDLTKAERLARQIAIRDIKAQYRQTALGYIWIFLIPTANTTVWILIHRAGIIHVADPEISYPVFVLTGTILWSIFMDAVAAPLQQATTAKPMLAKINFPHESLIISAIYQTAFNAIIRVTVLMIALILLGILPTWTNLLAPFSVLSIILAGTMLGVLLTPIGLLYTDVGRSLPLLLQFLMFFSPVVYPKPQSGLVSDLVSYNPLTPLIISARSLLTGESSTHLLAAAIVTLGILTLMLFAWIAYRCAMPILIERMSA